MSNIYKYKYSKRVVRGSLIFLAAVLLAVFIIRWFTHNNYLVAWILGVVLAVMSFIALSIPRFVRVSASMLEIHCLLELTHINMEDIVSVTKLERRDMKWAIPIAASCGFCGHFGYYLDVRNWNILKVYASSWDNLVVVQDIYEDLFVLNCDSSDEFIEQVIGQRNARRKQVAAESIERNLD